MPEAPELAPAVVAAEPSEILAAPEPPAPKAVKAKAANDDATASLDAPVSFGAKISWLAIKTTDGPAVAAAMGLTAIAPCRWSVGIDAAYVTSQRSLFVGSPIDGWTLVVGVALPSKLFDNYPDPSGEHPEVGKASRALIERLSGQFGEVQFFATDRVSESHAWARARGGAIERMFSYSGQSGEVFANVGDQTIEEAFVGLVDPGPRGPEQARDYLLEREEEQSELEEIRAAREEETIAETIEDFDEAEAEDDGLDDEGFAKLDLDRPPHAFPDEQDVFDLAAAWSVDTYDLETKPPGMGLIGEAPEAW